MEAVLLPGARGFLLGVLWHPEWAADRDPVSRAIFQAFAQAMAGGFSQKTYGKNGSYKKKMF